MAIVADDNQSPETVFRSHLAEGELWMQACSDCTRQVFYPRVLCPHCDGTLHWEKSDGAGVVYSTTIVRQRPDRGGDYNISIVELREGARMMTRVEGISPPDVRIGMAVRADIVDSDAGKLVIFRPADGGGK